MSISRVLLVILLVTFANSARAKKPANCVEVDGRSDRIVCVCSKQKCDWLRYEFPTQSGLGHFISTTKQGERFQVSDIKIVEKPPADSLETIKVNLSARFQSILGWGGAFTDATGVAITSLSQETQRTLIESYFDRYGLRYNMGRIPIGGSDFSPRNYTYDDLLDGEVDYNLEKWSLAQEDHKYKLPIIKQAQQMRSNHSYDTLKLFAASWSPPAWMKDNHNLTRGHLIDEPKIYQAYADYLIKFYKTYQKELNLNIWGGTVTNEPASAVFPSYYFNSLELGSYQTAKFVGQYFGPTLVRNGFTKDKFKLMAGDDNLGLINHLVPPIMADQEASKYYSGLAFHWYASGWQEPYDKLVQCVDTIKGKIDFVLMTEACTGWKKGKEPAVILGSWERGEQYAVDIIQDLLRQSAGWVDWNMALDMEGGPNWVNNTVDSPIIVNKLKDEFYKQPMYYVLGHFSRFFTPGSIRVGTTPETRGYDDKLMSVAVHNEKLGVVVVNLFNRSPGERSVNLNIENTNYSLTKITLAPHSIGTVILKL